MCSKHPIEKKHSLAGFFRAHWEGYLKNPKEPILPEQYRAVNAMMACRTIKLGVDIYSCGKCNTRHFVYHSCGHRFCPTCGYLDTQKWCRSILAKMANRPHHHIVVMLPSGFRGLARNNRKVFYGLFMAAAAHALKDYFRAKWDAVPGIMAVLHTFGDDKKYHVHTHMIVTAGGIDLKTGEYKEIDTKKWFVDYSWFCNEKFRPELIKSIRRHLKNNKLQHNFGSLEEIDVFLEKQCQKKWRMFIDQPLNNTEHIVKYIGRYTKRACLSEYKISNIEGENISFGCKDYKNSPDKKNPKTKTVTMHYRDFFPHLLQHVPEKYFRTVRYYGIYHRMDKNVPEELRKSKEELEQIAQKELKELESHESPLACPICHQQMQYRATLIDRRKMNRRQIKKYTIPDGMPGYILYIKEKPKPKKCA